MKMITLVSRIVLDDLHRIQRFYFNNIEGLIYSLPSTLNSRPEFTYEGEFWTYVAEIFTLPKNDQITVKR